METLSLFKVVAKTWNFINYSILCWTIYQRIRSFFGIAEIYQKISILTFYIGFASVFLIVIIFVPFSTSKPFIPDDIENSKLRREQFEWNLGMYGLYILFFGVIVWIIHSSLKGGVPSNWMMFFFIFWIGSALIMWSPPVRKWINDYYEKNTKEE